MKYGISLELITERDNFYNLFFITQGTSTFFDVFLTNLLPLMSALFPIHMHYNMDSPFFIVSTPPSKKWTSFMDIPIIVSIKTKFILIFFYVKEFVGGGKNSTKFDLFTSLSINVRPLSTFH